MSYKPYLIRSSSSLSSITASSTLSLVILLPYLIALLLTSPYSSSHLSCCWNSTLLLQLDVHSPAAAGTPLPCCCWNSPLELQSPTAVGTPVSCCGWNSRSLLQLELHSHAAAGCCWNTPPLSCCWTSFLCWGIFRN